MKLQGITNKGFERIARTMGKQAQEDPYDELDSESANYDTDAEELVLFIDNDGDLYRQRTVPIYKNLAKKMEKGVYDHDLAVKLMMYLADAGAQKYAKDMGYSQPWHKVFPKSMRLEAAEHMATYFEQLWQNGEISDVASW